MIGKLRGVVDAVGAEEVVLDVGGVGYLVQCGARTLSRLPPPGEAAVLHIETHVREDAIRLFGFLSEDDRAWFVRLQVIQGVGAKVALSILDVLSPGELMTAASHEDKAAVARANGVGPRLAQRIVTELKDKPAPTTRYGAPVRAAAPAPVPAGAGGGGAVDESEVSLRADAVSALVNLGVEQNGAVAAVAAARAGFGEAPGVDALVKAALQEIGR